MAYYQVSYHPLCSTPFGRNSAVGIHSRKPFLDHSCRREPDFTSENPGITALCRGANFAPKLKVGDRIAYITVKRTYSKWVPCCSDGSLITACLEVITVCKTHHDAEQWYNSRGFKVPSNCITPTNGLLQHELTGGHFDKRGVGVHGINNTVFNSHTPAGQAANGKVIVSKMDGVYAKRAKANPCFVITKWITGNTSCPPQVIPPNGKKPGYFGVENFRSMNLEEFDRLLDISLAAAQLHP